MKYIRHMLLLSTTSILFVGCQQAPQVIVAPTIEKKVEQPIKKAPKKVGTIQEVEDDNFSPEYMYPDTDKPNVEKQSVKKEPIVIETEMSREECIGMIGENKFNSYAERFGGDAAAIKKCKMLKAL